MNEETEIFEESGYDREKTLAIITGLVCALIFLCGTLLGGIHSMTELGMLGVLSVACYLICDAAVAWAAYIDYQEDNNAMEWTAWAVKYVLSAYLLFSGGCIAYLMIKNAGNERQTANRSAIYQEQYDRCMQGKGANPVSCRKLASEFNKGEAASQNEHNQAKEKNAEFVETYLNWPLFKYFPGLLGLGGLFALTLVSKLMRTKKTRNHSQPKQFSNSKASVRMTKQTAPFVAPSKTRYKAVSNGKRGKQAASFRFSPSGNNYSVNLRYDGRELYGMLVSDAEAAVYSTSSFQEIAQAVINERKFKNKKDQTAKLIESLM